MCERFNCLVPGSIDVNACCIVMLVNRSIQAECGSAIRMSLMIPDPDAPWCWNIYLHFTLSMTG